METPACRPSRAATLPTGSNNGLPVTESVISTQSPTAYIPSIEVSIILFTEIPPRGPNLTPIDSASAVLGRTPVMKRTRSPCNSFPPRMIPSALSEPITFSGASP